MMVIQITGLTATISAINTGHWNALHWLVLKWK